MRPARRGTWAGALLAAVLVALALALLFAAPPPRGTDGSAEAFHAQGRRAWRMLLESCGHRSAIWKQPPARLPAGASVLVQAEPPWQPPAARRNTPDALEDLPRVEHEEAGSAEPEAGVRERARDGGGRREARQRAASPAAITPASLGARAREHALSHYRAFVERGGTLVVPWTTRTHGYLTSGLGLDPELLPALVPFDAGELRVSAADGAGFRFEARAKRAFALPAPGALARVLWLVQPDTEPGEEADATAPAEQALALRLPLGRGEIVLLADDAFLSNERIGAQEHAALALRLAEEFSTGAELLLDEYALGLWSPPSALALVWGPSLALVSLHALLLLALFTWMLAAPRAFAREGDPPGSASPALRARAQARLLLSARRPELLADLLRSGVRARLERRARLAPGRAQRERPPIARLAERLGAPDEVGELARLLEGPLPRNPQDLERLGIELAALERRLDREPGASGAGTR